MKKSWLIIASFFLLAGCFDDTSGPSRMWTNNAWSNWFGQPSIENIWPNEDQTAWAFDYTWDENPYWSIVTYPDSIDVPPLPDWRKISSLLTTPLLGDSIITAHGTYRMAFNGMATAGGGVTAQNLEESFEFTRSGAAPVAMPVSGEAEFLRRLQIARPDLANKLPGTELAPEAAQLVARNPILIHGGVWEKTSSWIGTYGDIDALLAWKFLTDNLRPGSEFTFQLLPSMADNIYLHCRIDRQLTVKTAVGDLKKAIDCLYLVDLGNSQVFNPTGGSQGYARGIIYGRVIYAPSVGPVYCHERPLADTTDLMGASDMELTLGEFDEP